MDGYFIAIIYTMGIAVVLFVLLSGISKIRTGSYNLKLNAAVVGVTWIIGIFVHFMTNKAPLLLNLG